MDQKIQIEMSTPHARAVSDALEIVTRIGARQFSILGQLLGQGIIVDDNGNPISFEKACMAIEQLEKLNAILGARELGIANELVQDSVKAAYEVKKVLDKSIVDVTGVGRNTVMNDGLIVSYTQNEKPIAKVIE